MEKIFTIGFTRLTAEEFFTLLEDSGVRRVVDVRLFTKSQLLGFTKYPDIEYFLRRLVGIDYFHDAVFAPTEPLFNRYKKNYITWREYEQQFDELMAEREVDDYIRTNYAEAEGICLLCAEPSPDTCHRRLVAERIAKVLGDIKIVHL